MPEPNKGETKEEYMPRCIRVVKGEGLPQARAVAKCNGMWESAHGDEEKPDDE